MASSLHPCAIKTNLTRHLPPRDEPEESDAPSSFRYKTIPQCDINYC